jgi:hypothetical protein
MSQSEEPQPPARSTRKQTPRVPSNVLYDRVVPITLGVMAVLLVIVVIVAIIGLLGVIR